MTNTIRGMNRGELITETTHAQELLDNGKIEEARIFVKILCQNLAENPSQLDKEVPKDVIQAYLNGIISLLELREAA